MIPFLNLRSATEELRSELDKAYHNFMDSGWYVLGEEVEQFEIEYADYCSTDIALVLQPAWMLWNYHSGHLI